MSMVKFQDVVVRANTTEDKDNTDKLYYVGGEHFISGELTVENKGIIAGSTIGMAFYFGFKKGQTLFVTRNPHLRKAGMATFDGLCSEKTFVLEPRDKKLLLPEYLPLILQSERFWNYMESHKSGSVNFFVNWSALANYEFNLPPIEEQARIADLLWAMNDTKKAYRNLLAATDELVKARFVEMFGDPDLNPKRYKLKPLNEIAEYWNGLTYKPTDVSENGTIVLRSSNIQNASLDFSDIVRVNCEISNRKFVNENDILMCSRNGSANLVGKVALISNIKERMTFGAFMMVVRSKYNSYLLTYFQLPTFKRQIIEGATTTIKQITNKMLDKILIPLPDEESIRDFAEFSVQINKSRAAIGKTIEQAERLYHGLLRRYLQ